MQSENQISVLGEILAWGCMFASFALPLFYYDQLPDQIPTHYNAKGEPDAYSAKAAIWILPFIGLATFFLLHYIGKSKNLKINEPGPKKILNLEERAYKLKIGKQMLLALKLIIPASICYIVYRSIQIALGQATGLGIYFLLIFLTVTFSIIGYYSYKIAKPPNNIRTR